MFFWRSFFGICRGPQAAPELLKNSWSRVWWHFFLICFFCALFIGIANYFLIEKHFRTAVIDFSNTFGSWVTFSEKGIVPEITPDKSRWQELPDNSLLIYAAPQDRKVYEDNFLKDRNWFVVWNPGTVACFVQNEGLWQITVCGGSADGKNAEDENELPALTDVKYDLDFPAMKAEFNKVISADVPAKLDFAGLEKQGGLSSRQLFFVLLFSFSAVTAVGYFLISFSSILFITFFFSVLFKIFSGARSSGMPFGNLWKLALYAAFPVLLVVSFFPAFQLPGSAFYTNFFMIGWAVYLFVILKYLALNQHEVEEAGEETDNE